jgi:hypothetical protein
MRTTMGIPIMFPIVLAGYMAIAIASAVDDCFFAPFRMED